MFPMFAVVLKITSKWVTNFSRRKFILGNIFVYRLAILTKDVSKQRKLIEFFLRNITFLSHKLRKVLTINNNLKCSNHAPFNITN